MSADADVIVVGSGPAGAQAAETLVEHGCRVLMLDTGTTAAPDAAAPRGAFLDLRRHDRAQHRYFLGDDFSGVPLARLGAAPQVTPPRRHVLQLAAGYAGILADNFAALESHALGGLGAAWGAVSFPFTDGELRQAGFAPADLRPAYERVARRIGICGAHDDTAPWIGPLESLQPPLPLDHNASALLAAYTRQRAALHRRRVRVGRPMLAALSQPLDERPAHDLADMDFWGDSGGSVYRPELTVRRLQRRDTFRYAPGWFVARFCESSDGRVHVTARAVADGAERTFTARQVFLAAGALGTTRIVLESFRETAREVPLVCNAHLYVPCVHLRQLGRPHSERCHSLAQLSMLHDPTGDGSALVQAQMYSYRSLLLFRLLKESPLPARDSLWIMRALAPAFVIWALEEEDRPADGRFCRLAPCADGGTVLEVVAPDSPDVEAQRRDSQGALLWATRRLGAWPIRRVHSGPGSSLHYGGQFPMSERDEPFTTDATGRLQGTRQVFIGDGSAFRYLPAKGLTFTLMANADRVACAMARCGR